MVNKFRKILAQEAEELQFSSFLDEDFSKFIHHHHGFRKLDSFPLKFTKKLCSYYSNQRKNSELNTFQRDNHRNSSKNNFKSISLLKYEIFPGGEKVINNANLQIFTGPSRASFLIQKLPPCFQIIYHFSVQGGSGWFHH